MVITLHTVLDRPSEAPQVVMNAILAASARIIVVPRKGRKILIDTYAADPEKIAIIRQGIPDAPFGTLESAKLRLGYAGRNVILTFGLISPDKSIETMIEAMPAVIAGSPDARLHKGHIMMRAFSIPCQVGRAIQRPRAGMKVGHARAR